jgi:hypothetical protein
LRRDIVTSLPDAIVMNLKEESSACLFADAFARLTFRKFDRFRQELSRTIRFGGRRNVIVIASEAKQSGDVELCRLWIASLRSQ